MSKRDEAKARRRQKMAAESRGGTSARAVCISFYAAVTHTSWSDLLTRDMTPEYAGLIKGVPAGIAELRLREARFEEPDSAFIERAVAAEKESSWPLESLRLHGLKGIPSLEIGYDESVVGHSYVPVASTRAAR
jgi:hypothetical protein